MSRDQDYIDEEKQKQDQLKQGCRISVNGCLYIIILAALAGIMIKECKRADMRLKRDKANYEYYQDSIKGAQR